MIVDAHQHFWDPSLVTYPWLASNFPELDRRFDVEDLAPHLHQSGIDATVVVQSENDVADNELTLNIASRSPQILGVVGWAPLDDRPALDVELERLHQCAKFVGIRVLIPAMADPDWILRRDVQDGLSVLEAEGLTFDVLVGELRHLEHVPVIAERHPNLRLVIDHLAKPPVGRDLSTWSERLQRAAACPNVFAKVSGLYPAGGDRLPWTVDDLRPAFEFALGVFGAQRLMLGSDWPICEVAGGYGTVMGALVELTKCLSADEQSEVRGGTAIRFYGLKSARAATP